MTANLQDYRRAAKSLLRGRGFSFAVLLTLGILAGTAATVSQVSQAVLRPVAHALGISKRRECSQSSEPAQRRERTRAQDAKLSNSPESGLPASDPRRRWPDADPT